ncbi:MAG: hypothetical protein ABID64_01940 [Nitrospirota bacterium]
MKTKRMKKWGKRILLGLLISLTVSIIAPTFMGDNIVNEHENTAYAATTPACKFPADTQPECKMTGGETVCPTGGYAVDTADKTLCKKATTAAKTDEGILNIMKFLIKIQDILNRALWPVLVMIGGLMDNSLLFGNGMEERLREIWIPIRNIVNILFVIALVAIALYNVLGIGDENSNYSIKAILPKIIIGIIVVNFSFLGIKVFLDGINVLTSAIFALPNQVGQGIALDPNNPNDQELIQKACRSTEGIDYNAVIDKDKFIKDKSLEIFKDQAKKYKLEIDPSATVEQIGKLAGDKLTAVQLDAWVAEYDEKIKSILCETTTVTTVDPNDKTKTTTKTTMKFTARGELFMKRWNSRNAALAMAIGLSKIVLYKEIDVNSLTIDKLFINTALSLIMYLLFVASFIALFVVLLGRLVVMWLAIALSPVLLLAMVIPAVKENFSSFGEVTNTFVQNAIAPLGIGLSLSIGWIMLKALQGINSLYGGEQISFTATQGIPVVGLTTLQDLLVGVGTIAVIWLGVFTAASKSIAAPVTDWMKGSLASAGKWVGTLPLKHAPIFKIDLPGTDDDTTNTYTGSQMLEAFGALTGRPKNSGLLAERLTGVKRVSSSDMASRDMDSPEKVLSWLKNARNQNMSASDLQSAMVTLKRRDLKLYTQMRDSKYGDIHTKMEAMTKTSGKEREAAKTALLDHSRVRGYSAPSATTTGTTTPTKVGGVTLNASQTTQMNQQVTILKGTTDKAKIDTGLRTLADNIPTPKSARTLATLKNEVLGATVYAKVLKNGYENSEAALLKAFQDGTKK